MKNKIKTILITVACTVTIAGCAPQQQSSGALEDVISSENLIIESTEENNKPTLTISQMLEDYDAMWAILEDNYPHFGTIGRKFAAKGYSSNYYLTLKDQYREKIQAMTNESDEAVVEFIDIMDQCLTEVGQHTAHLKLITPEIYPMFAPIYNDAMQKYPEEFQGYDIYVNTLEDENTVKMYDYYISLMSQETEESVRGDETGDQEQNATGAAQEPENLELAILDDGKTAYMKIRSFPSDNESEIQRILEFYDLIKDCPNLVIDITDNNGGDATYWAQSIVSPNITKATTISSISLIPSGALAKEFLSDVYEDSNLTIEDVRNNPAFINLQEEDLDKLSLAAAAEMMTIQPSGQDALYKGKTWLLVNDKVYSSAEIFAAFCKQSGFATLVGQTTEGDGGGSKDPIIATLPNSRLLFRFSAEYSLNPDGSCNQEIGTVPDIESNMPMETCLELIKQGTN